MGLIQHEQPMAFPIMMDVDQAERWTQRAEQKRRVNLRCRHACQQPFAYAWPHLQLGLNGWLFYPT